MHDEIVADADLVCPAINCITRSCVASERASTPATLPLRMTIMRVLRLMTSGNSDEIINMA